MKREIGDLAVFGGPPAFAETLHVGSPNIADRERVLERIKGVLDRRWLTNNGPCVQELERKIADLVGVRHCMATCNGTIALEIAIRALGLSGEVVVPAFTFIATAHALQWQGITPVFCDVDPQTLCLDPNRVDDLITPHTTGIIGVHVFGQACAVDSLQEIAARHGFGLIYDAAHAFCCSAQGRMIGGFGHAEVFSFHATKFFNTFEGGAVVTNDDDLAARVRLMRNFGFAGFDNVVCIGTNGKMNEAAAAMGLASLECLDEIIATNRLNYDCYRQSLVGIPGVTMRQYDEREKANYQHIVLLVDEYLTGISRDRLHHILHAENVLARRYFYPGCHRMAPYRSHFPNGGLLLPETERLMKRVLLLPTGTAVRAEDIARISELIRFAVQNGCEISQAFVQRDSPLLANALVG